MPVPFDIAAVLLGVTAAFAWLNYRVFRLPNAVGLLLMGFVASLILVALREAFPQVQFFRDLTEAVRRIDFSAAVLNGLLGLLLFAFALNTDVSSLRDRKWTVGAMATIGVLISTVFVGAGLWLAARALNVPISLAWALVFGALISPTDPIAVISVLKEYRVSETLETDMTGESLFNDGVSLVLFPVLLAVAMGAPGASEIGLVEAGYLLIVQAIGGAGLGLLTGLIAYRAMAGIDDYPIEILISLALVTCTYALALHLQVSGPIAVVVAGVLIGSRGAAHAMSKTTRRYLFGFWSVVDDLLNLVLFLLIGLEVIVIGLSAALLPLALAAIPITLAARYAAVSTSVLLLRATQEFESGTIPILTWGGVRGAVSVALALSIPPNPQKPALLAATYTVAIWTIVVQGMTLPWVVRRAGNPAQLSPVQVDGSRRNP